MNDMLDWGYSPFADADALRVARITAVHKERYEIVSCRGETHARLKSAVYYSGKEEQTFPTVGDFVLIQHNDAGDSLIERTLERWSRFARSDFSGHAAGYVKAIFEQTVAANFDYVFVMTSLNQEFSLGRIERYLTLAWESGAVPVVVLTKADLCEDFSQQLESVRRIAPGVDVLAVSVKSGLGLEALGQYARPRKTIVFLGSSGVGKSSLVNALAGEEIMRVSEIREQDARGRHTTAHRQLIRLQSGAMIIDTPGMRELGLWDASQAIGGAFADVGEVIAQCRFSDCTHGNEPDCAVRAALESGALPQARWDSFVRLEREARFVENKAAFLRRKNQRNKELAMWSKKRNKDGGDHG